MKNILPLSMPMRYLLAIGIAVAALGIRFLVLPLEAELPFVTFFPGAVIAALLCGTGPTLLYIVLAAVTGSYIFIAPFWSFSDKFSIRGLVFVVAATAILQMIQSYKQRVARQARMLTDAIAAHQLAEQALRESDQRREAAETVRQSQHAQLTGLVDSAMDAIIMVDDAQRIVLFNPAAEAMFGRRAADVIGGPHSVLIPQRSRAVHAEHIRAFAASGVTQRRMGRLGAIAGLRANGEEFPLEAAISQVKTEGGRYFTVILRDLSERQLEAQRLKEAKSQAEAANNAKSRFLAASSHDLRQPLSALSIYVNSLKDKVAPADQVLVSNMKECIGSLSGLLTDLLDLSKLEAGVVKLHISDFSVARMLSRLESVHTPAALLKGLQLRCRPTRFTAHTDPVLLNRIIGNLIDNAIRYTERGGVLVACRRRQGKHWIEVWDTGIGIPAGRTQEVFEEFKQLDEGARSRGSGLGLAIVAKSALLLGLEISVRSRLDHGSVFAIEVPPGQAEMAESATAPSAVADRSLRIALVEDNALVREALVFGLRGLGHQVLATSTKAAVLGELEQTPPDIVVSDYRLTQGETGFDVISAVRAGYGAEIPAIIITGDTDPQLLRQMTDHGIVVLHKPVDLESLQAFIEDLTYQTA